MNILLDSLAFNSKPISLLATDVFCVFFTVAYARNFHQINVHPQHWPEATVAHFSSYFSLCGRHGGLFKSKLKSRTAKTVVTGISGKKGVAEYHSSSDIKMLNWGPG
jgi:hypothetical protein